MKPLLTILLLATLTLIFGNLFFHYDLKTNNITAIYDKNWQLLAGVKNLKYNKIDEFPKKFRDILLLIEDQRFFNHYWTDFIGLGRALLANIKAWKIVQWGSTIDQQVVKISESAYKRNFTQKIREIFLSLNLNFHHEKNDILLYYINNLEFLNWIKWFKSACKVYFDKKCESLFVSEKLFLISVYQTWKNPLNSKNFEILKKRSIALCNSIVWKAPSVTKYTCKNLWDLPPITTKKIKYNTKNLAPHFSLYSASTGNTKFDLKLFKNIEKIIANSWKYRKSMWIGDCCILVLDKAWDILSMNVCRNWDNLFAGQVNGCTSSRQTWSVMKPFLYMFAMQKLWLDPTSIIKDKPVKFLLDAQNIYSPKNFDMKYHWDVTIAQALWSSLNVPAVILLSKVWVDEFINFIDELKTEVWAVFDSKKGDWAQFDAATLWLSAALWTYEMNPLDFGKLWTVFLNWSWDISQSYAKQINEIYQILSTNTHRTLSFWLDNYIDIPWWAVKTGTSRHFVDWWTCWVNNIKQLIVCVWAGNYNWSAMKGSWIKTAGYLWHQMVGNILSK